jgi:hypothetical protein
MDRKKKFTDEEIQTILDPKNPSGGYSQGGLSHEDAEVYEMLMSHLEQQPEINIPRDFAINITASAIREKMKRDFARKVLLYLSVSLPLIIAGFLVIYFMAPDMLPKLVAFVGNNILAVTFSFAVLAVVQLLDNLLIRNKLKEAGQ